MGTGSGKLHVGRTDPRLGAALEGSGGHPATWRHYMRQERSLGDADYLCYRSELRPMARRAGCVVHAYGLMTNHVHRDRVKSATW